MKPVIILIILILALAGIGAIVFVVNRGKCIIPSGPNPCKTNGQAPFCTSQDSVWSCEDIVKTVCGPQPDGQICTFENCTYDDTSQKYKWTGCRPSGSQPVIKDVECTLTADGSLPYGRQYGDTFTNIMKPAYNYDKYIQSVSGTRIGCNLTSCKDTDIISSDGLCIPKDGINTLTSYNDCAGKFISGEKHSQTDVNASWSLVYNEDTLGTAPVGYCKFNDCNTTFPKNNGVTCVAADPVANQCTNKTLYPIGGDTSINTWTWDGTKCVIPSIGGCMAGYTVNPAQNLCLAPCAANPRFTWINDPKTGKCVQGPCNSGYTGSDCKINCQTPPQSEIIRIFGQTPPPDYHYSLVSDDESLDKCIPSAPSAPDDLIGGCGDSKNKDIFYVLNKKNDGCVIPVNGYTAKFNSGFDATGVLDGTTRGCLACQPRYCRVTDKILDCIGVEDGCGYTSMTASDPVQTCVNTIITDPSGKLGLFEWETFGDYEQNLLDIGKKPTTGNKAIFNGATTLFIESNGTYNGIIQFTDQPPYGNIEFDGTRTFPFGPGTFGSGNLRLSCDGATKNCDSMYINLDKLWTYVTKSGTQNIKDNKVYIYLYTGDWTGGSHIGAMANGVMIDLSLI